jgi:hypothetical protein
MTQTAAFRFCDRPLGPAGRRRIFCCVWLGVLAVVLSGCGSRFDSTVSGKVTLGTTPLTKGNVSFHPVSQGPVAIGTIAGDGSYSVSTGAEGGLPAGEYKVTVVATDPPPADEPEAAGLLLTPAEYGDVKRTPLSFTVKPGKNNFDIAL